MSLLLTFILLFLAGLHLYSNWRIQPHSLYLSGALLSVSYSLAIHYLVIFGTSAFWLALLFGHFTPLIYLMGPMLFFYVRGVLTDNPRLRKYDILHLVPALLDSVTRIPYVLKPWSHKLWMAGELMADIGHLHTFADEFFPPSNIALPLRMGVMIGYTLYCLWMVWHFKRNYFMSNRVPIQVAIVTIRFLVLLLVVCSMAEISLTLLVVKFFMGKQISQTDVIQDPLLWLSFLGVFSIPVIMQLHPAVLYGIPRWRGRDEDGEKTDLPRAPEGHPAATNEEWKKSDPSRDRFEVLADQITHYLETEKPYLNPDFSIEDVSKSLGVPKHHLYYCFSHIIRKKFTQVRTVLRIQYACELIQNGASQEKTLEAIGLESGFSSRSAFIMAFREIKGMTPRNFHRTVEVQ